MYRPTTTISAPAPAQPKVQAPVEQVAPGTPKQTFTPTAAAKTQTVTQPKTSSSYTYLQIVFDPYEQTPIKISTASYKYPYYYSEGTLL